MQACSQDGFRESRAGQAAKGDPGGGHPAAGGVGGGRGAALRAAPAAPPGFRPHLRRGPRVPAGPKGNLAPCGHWKEKPVFLTHREELVQVVSECVFLFASDAWKGNSAERTPGWSPDPNFLNPGSGEVPVPLGLRVLRALPLSRFASSARPAHRPAQGRGPAAR